MCDLFHTLSEEDQQDIADYLGREPYEVMFSEWLKFKSVLFYYSLLKIMLLYLQITEKLAELKASMHFGVNEDWVNEWLENKS